MTWVAAAIFTGSVVNGYLGSQAASDAADAQRQAGQDANALQWQMFNQNRTDLAPWREAGANALASLRAGTADSNSAFMRPFSMADFQADPGYGFRLSEGLKALQSSAAGKGTLRSGNTLKAITDYGQNAASQEYTNAFNRYQTNQGNQFNRLASIAGLGQNAVNTSVNAGANTANSVADTIIGMGNASAAGRIGGANAIGGAISNGIGQGLNFYNQNQLLNLLKGQGGGYSSVYGYTVPGQTGY